jgi:hypothetical protein
LEIKNLNFCKFVLLVEHKMERGTKLKKLTKNICLIYGIFGTYNITRLGFHQLLSQTSSKYSKLSVDSQRRITSYFSSIINALYTSLFSLKKIIKNDKSLDNSNALQAMTVF